MGYPKFRLFGLENWTCWTFKKIIFDKRFVGKWKKNLMNWIIKKSSNLTINLEESSKEKELGLSIGFLTHFLKSTQKSDFQVLIPGPH